MKIKFYHLVLIPIASILMVVILIFWTVEGQKRSPEYVKAKEYSRMLLKRMDILSAKEKERLYKSLVLETSILWMEANCQNPILNPRYFIKNKWQTAVDLISVEVTNEPD